MSRNWQIALFVLVALIATIAGDFVVPIIKMLLEE